MATLRELAGEGVEVRVDTRDIALDVPFDGSLVEGMPEALRAEDPEATVLPYCLSGGTDNKALSLLGITGYGFAPLRLPEDLDFAPDVPWRRRAGPGGLAAVRGPGAGPARQVLLTSRRGARMILRRNQVRVRPPM